MDSLNTTVRLAEVSQGNATAHTGSSGSHGTPPSIFDGGTPLHEPISILLVQAALIIILSRSLHFVLNRLFKSHRVVSEVLAGMILGSGLYAESYKNNIWSLASTNLLGAVSQFGIVLFCFMIGLEADPSSFLKSRKIVFLTASNIFLLPLAASVGVSWYLYSLLPSLSSNYVPVAQGPFIFYTAVCMAWTGLPVVNRILANSRLYKNPIAALSGDVSNVNAIMTWVVLMYLIPYAENSQDPYKALAIFNAVLAVFILFWWILDIVMTRIARMATTSESLSQLSVLLTFCMVFFFSWFTQAMGAHAIFGALLVGLRTPHNHRFSIKIAEKMEDILMILFVPIYYGLVGVLASIAFINGEFSGLDWGLMILILVVSSLSKILFTALMGMYFEHSWRSSAAMGILLNQKGYVGLLVLNIGFRAGIIPRAVFTMLVIVMLLSSAFTIPLVAYILPPESTTENANASVKSLQMEKVSSLEHGHGSTATILNEPVLTNELSILLSLPKLQTVPSIMSLVQLFRTSTMKIKVSTLRFNEINDRESSMMMATLGKDENTPSDPIMSVIQTFGQLNGIEMNCLSAISCKQDFSSTVIKASIEEHSNLILLPFTISKSTNSTIDVHLWSHEFNSTPCTLGLFLDRGFGISKSNESQDIFHKEDSLMIHKVYFPCFDNEDDEEVFSLISYMVQSSNVQIEISYILSDENQEKNQKLDLIKGLSNVIISYHTTKTPNSLIAIQGEKLSRTDLIILGMKSYKGFLKAWIDQVSNCSVLIVQKHSIEQIQV